MRQPLELRARKMSQPGTQRFRWVVGWAATKSDAEAIVRALRCIPGFLDVKAEGSEPLLGIYAEADVTDERNTRHLTGIAEGVIRMVEYSEPQDPNPEIPRTPEHKSMKNLFRKNRDPKQPDLEKAVKPKKRIKQPVPA